MLGIGWRRGALFFCALVEIATAGAVETDLGEKYAPPAETGRALIGTKAPEWHATDWMNSEPLTLEALRGKVVLVRWWTAPGCPYCKASANALNEWAERYRARGLVVIGMYHHKAKSPVTRAHVAAHAKELGFEFPIAIDPEWRTLRSWWLDREPGGWTSASFLVDRGGVIRHVHGGGAYFKGEPGYTAFKKAIEYTLAQ